MQRENDRRGLVVLLAAVCALSYGCAADMGTDREADSGRPQTEEASSALEVEGSEAADITEDTRLYTTVIDQINNRVELIDLTTGKTAGTVSCDPGESLQEVYEYDGGFALLYKEDGDSEDEVEQVGDDLVFVTSSFEIDRWEAYTLVLYDFDCNLTERIPLLDTIRQDEVDIQGNPVLSADAKTIAWETSDVIYYIDLSTGESGFADAAQRENISIRQMNFVGTDKIGFWGDKEPTGETDVCYGCLDLQANTVAYQVAEDYEATTMYTNSRFFCVNDSESPYTGTSSGRILLFDCETGEGQELAVEDLESTFSMVTEDGATLISIDWREETSFRIRNYDMESMEVIYETTCAKEDSVRPWEIKKYGDSYVVVYLSDEWGAVYAVDNR